MPIWRMRIACWVTKATKTHSQYVILTAFKLQQLLHERASMLHRLSCLNVRVSYWTGLHIKRSADCIVCAPEVNWLLPNVWSMDSEAYFHFTFSYLNVLYLLNKERWTYYVPFNKTLYKYHTSGCYFHCYFQILKNKYTDSPVGQRCESRMPLATS